MVYFIDDRAILFEKQRLRLRKLVQTYGVTTGGSSSAHSTHTHTPGRSRAATPPQTPSPSLAPHHASLSLAHPTSTLHSLGIQMYLADTGGASGTQTPRSVASVAKRPATTHSSSQFPSSSFAAPRSRPSASPSHQLPQQQSASKIYAWESAEGARSAQQRQPIEVDGVTFDPSSTEGELVTYIT